MRTVETTVYKFEELSNAAKEKAREWYRDSALDYDWYDFVFEDADVIAKILGIKIDRKRDRKSEPAIWFSGFYSQGDGACFEGSYAYATGARQAIRAHAPKNAELHRIADGFLALQRAHGYTLTASVKHRGHYYHSRCTDIDVDGRIRATDGVVEDELSELLRDFMEWIYRQLERESEYLLTDEQVDESIRANEYEFEENGSIA